MKARIKYMDIAKGIGMICVLAGHTYYNQVWAVVNTFHMPLFFIISGYFFSPQQKLNYKNNKKLLIPYFITILAFILYDIMNRNYKDALIWMWGGIYGSGYDYATPFLMKGVGGIWFLLALFWVKIITNEIVKFRKDTQIWLAIVITYIGVKTYSCFVFPWSIQNGMMASFFYFFGYYAKKENLFEHIRLVHIISLSIMWFYCYKYYGTLVMVNCNIPNIMTVIGALCGSVIIIYISMILEKKIIIVGDILNSIGKMTMIILCVHIFELHTGILVRFQGMLLEKTHLNIHIFILRCVWSLGVAAIIKIFISRFRKTKI